MMRFRLFRSPVGACKRRSDSQAGFTLVELLTVVALVVFLVGGIGMALNTPGGNALSTAQNTIASMVGAARAHAAVNQTETILAIYASRPPAGEVEKFLRTLQVFQNSNPGAASPTWVPVGQAVTLPRGVSVVPTSVNGLLATGVIWPANPPLLSSIRGPIGLGQPAGTPFGGAVTAYVIDFTPDGTVGPIAAQGYGRVVIASSGISATNQPQFTSNATVRGLLLRPTGAVTYVNEINGF